VVAELSHEVDAAPPFVGIDCVLMRNFHRIFNDLYFGEPIAQNAA
jgi:hypothetical protein